MIRAYESAQTMRGQAPDDLHPTVKKVQAFLRLQPGWHYGSGMAFTPDRIREALQVHGYATALGFYETDAFPGSDGSIMLTVYEGPDYIEFTLNPSGGLDYRRETDDVEVSAREGLTLSAAHDILREFRRETCKPFVSYTAGISILDEQCVLASGRTICEHIRFYYPTMAGDAPIFWRFSTDLISDPYTLEPEIGPGGDPCHYNIVGMTKNQGRRFFTTHCDRVDHVCLCREDGMHITPSLEQLQALAAKAAADHP